MHFGTDLHLIRSPAVANLKEGIGEGGMFL